MHLQIGEDQLQIDHQEVSSSTLALLPPEQHDDDADDDDADDDNCSDDGDDDDDDDDDDEYCDHHQRGCGTAVPHLKKSFFGTFLAIKLLIISY